MDFKGLCLEVCWQRLGVCCLALTMLFFYEKD